jgi:hypothetical protein
MPNVDTEAMQKHVEEIGRAVAAGTRTVAYGGERRG